MYRSKGTKRTKEREDGKKGNKGQGGKRIETMSLDVWGGEEDSSEGDRFS